MIDLTGVQHHPAITEMVDVLCNKTRNTDRSFFNVTAAYFFGKMASNMRAKIITKERGEVPVNIYAMALATSGFGKGHSISICEDEFMLGFKKQFLESTMPLLADQALWAIANDRAARDGTEPQAEFDKAEREYKRAGAFAYTFDSGTTPAVKQMRNKLLMAGCGSINMQIDEIGRNLLGSDEVLTVFLELYDQGKVKQKLVKNTAENERMEELEGKTPTNMLLFGTPSQLLDGAQREDMFYEMLETGYARRCLFAWGQVDALAYNSQTPAEIFQNLTQPQNDKTIRKWAAHFSQLADPGGYDWKMSVDDSVAIRLIEYQRACELEADDMPEHEEIRKAEMKHRYFKALKLAGAYAFIDASPEVEMDHLMSAILLVEESGIAFKKLLNREKPHVKLARYISTVGTQVTNADLIDALPYFKGGNNHRTEMLNLAIAWGYKQHIIIKKSFIDGIEFYDGATLEETNLDEIMVSYSDHWAYNYQPEKVPFADLHQLTQAAGMHWANHHFKAGHRAEENVLTGFNMVCIDVDGSVPLSTVHELLKEHRFMTYTTKRHQKPDPETGVANDRFRLMLPINYVLELDTAEYKDFMNSVMEWLPFKTDESANQRAKKWESFDGGTYHYNEGELLDALPFIPKTSRNEQFITENRKLQSLDNLERWFAQRIASGNRNNQMLKYALALVDSGMQLVDVNQQVHAFNKKLNTGLTEDEISSTIMVTVAKRYHKNAA